MPVVFHRNYLAVVFVTVETVVVVVGAGVVPHGDDDADTTSVAAGHDSDDGPCHRVVAV